MEALSSETGRADEAAADDAGAAEADGDSAPKTYTDLWSRIRAGLSMPKLDSPLVVRHERWFASNADFMRNMVERARRYLYYIVDEVEKRGMPMEIALLPAIESAYKPHAYSRARAAGLWQFIPSTGRLYGLRMNWWYDGRRDVMASTQAALDYLEKLYSDFDGDWQLALAAYNAGEGRVLRAIEYNRRKSLPTTFPYLKRLKWETRNYVPRLMAMVNIVADPGKYGVQLASIPNEPYFARVEIDSQVDLGVVADLVDVDINDLHSINPGFTRWATDPNGPHHLLVPVDKKDALIEGLSKLSDEDRVQWRRHPVKRGDTLYEISRRYRVSVRAIKAANRLRSNLLRAGQSLLIPISTRLFVGKNVARVHRVSAARPSGATQPVIHRVRRGDTLWAIARRYNVLVRQLAEWNLIDPRSILRLGQKLKIWTSGGPSAMYMDPQGAHKAGG